MPWCGVGRIRFQRQRVQGRVKQEGTACPLGRGRAGSEELESAWLSTGDLSSKGSLHTP